MNQIPQEPENAANVPNSLCRGNFDQGCPLFRSLSKFLPQSAETEWGFSGCKSEKSIFFGKNLFNFYHKAICRLAINWATKQCSILDAVTALLHIDSWKKVAKNTKNGPPEVIGNVISGLQVGAIPIKVYLSDTLNSALQ